MAKGSRAKVMKTPPNALLASQKENESNIEKTPYTRPTKDGLCAEPRYGYIVLCTKDDGAVQEITRK